MTTVPNKAVEDMRGQIKLTRNKIALLTAIFQIDGEEMTVKAFADLLERLYYRHDALQMFIEEEYKA